MEYLPIFLDLEDRLAVVIGGGEVAARKLELLRRAGARTRVVAPALGESIAALAAQGVIEYRAGSFQPEDLDGAELVIAATDVPAVNQAVAAVAHARHLPINVVDAPDLCSFIMPAIVDRGRIIAAISTGGASPVLARLIRARIELALPHGIERLAELAAVWRNRVKAALPDGTLRRRFWERLFAPRSAERILEGETPDIEALLAGNEPLCGRLERVEVPRDDPEALTLRAIRLLQSADLVLFEAGMPVSILEFARRDARRILVGAITPPEAATAVAEGHLVVALAFTGTRPHHRRGARQTSESKILRKRRQQHQFEIGASGHA